MSAAAQLLRAAGSGAPALLLVSAAASAPHSLLGSIEAECAGRASVAHATASAFPLDAFGLTLSHLPALLLFSSRTRRAWTEQQPLNRTAVRAACALASSADPADADADGGATLERVSPTPASATWRSRLALLGGAPEEADLPAVQELLDRPPDGGVFLLLYDSGVGGEQSRAASQWEADARRWRALAEQLTRDGCASRHVGLDLDAHDAPAELDSLLAAAGAPLLVYVARSEPIRRFEGGSGARGGGMGTPEQMRDWAMSVLESAAIRCGGGGSGADWFRAFAVDGLPALGAAVSDGVRARAEMVVRRQAARTSLEYRRVAAAAAAGAARGEGRLAAPDAARTMEANLERALHALHWAAVDRGSGAELGDASDGPAEGADERLRARAALTEAARIRLRAAREWRAELERQQRLVSAPPPPQNAPAEGGAAEEAQVARRAEAGLGGGGHIFEGLMWEELLEETVWLAEAVAAEANGRPRASPGAPS